MKRNTRVVASEYYERLQEEPQVEGGRELLKFDERGELRVIKIGGTGRGRSNTPKKPLTPVYYLAGDEERAVNRFVHENAELLYKIDFSERNLVESSVDREIYDQILHNLGVRRVKKYDTVVLETRPEGTQWIIGRQLYDDHPSQRYSLNEAARVPTGTSLRSVFERHDTLITRSDLSDTSIEGDTRQVLDYYRADTTFACKPTTAGDSQMAVRKKSRTRSFELVREAPLARTYDEYDDAWKTVQDYREFKRVQKNDPSKSVTEIADETGLSYGKVYDWLEREKIPYPVKGLRTAEEHGWVNIHPSDSVFEGFNQLLALVFSGGGISKRTFSPSFSLEHNRIREIVAGAFSKIGIDYHIVDRSEEGRGVEARPTEDGSILGRVLYVLGGPIGSKSEQDELSLPPYLYNVANQYRLAFARVYLLNRGVPSANPHSEWRVIGEPRPTRYLYELRDLFETVTNEQVKLDPKNKKIYVSNAAVRTIISDETLST